MDLFGGVVMLIGGVLCVMSLSGSARSTLIIGLVTIGLCILIDVYFPYPVFVGICVSIGFLVILFTIFVSFLGDVSRLSRL